MRHGNDEKYSRYKHDHSLNSDSLYEEEIIEKTKKLIKKYGYPDKIYCSPFKRVRETVNIIVNYINKYHKVKIYMDPNLSRYFTSKEKNNPSVRNTTLQYDPPIHESYSDFKKRVDKSHAIINHNDCNTWCITHYLVIKRITKNNNIDIPSKMPFLYHVVI